MDSSWTVGDRDLKVSVTFLRWKSRFMGGSSLILYKIMIAQMLLIKVEILT